VEWAAVPAGLEELAEDPAAAVEVLERDLDLVGAVQDLGPDLDEPFSAVASSSSPSSSS